MAVSMQRAKKATNKGMSMAKRAGGGAFGFSGKRR